MKEDKEENTLINRKSIEALIALVETVTEAGKKDGVMQLDPDTYEDLVDIVDKSNKFTDEEINDIKKKYGGKRKANMQKVIELSKTAKNIDKGKDFFINAKEQQDKEQER